MIFEAPNVPSSYSRSIPYEARHLTSLSARSHQLSFQMESKIDLTQKNGISIHSLSQLINRPFLVRPVRHDLEKVEIDSGLSKGKRNVLSVVSAIDWAHRR